MSRAVASIWGASVLKMLLTRLRLTVLPQPPTPPPAPVPSIDFGDCFVGETVTKRIPLTCNVPIQFGFEIKVIDPHPDFTISPLKGIIPASGSIDVVVEFRPAALRVCKMEVEVGAVRGRGWSRGGLTYPHPPTPPHTHTLTWTHRHSIPQPRSLVLPLFCLRPPTPPPFASTHALHAHSTVHGAGAAVPV